MKDRTNIQDLDKQFESTSVESSKQFETTKPLVGKQFHNSKLKNKILSILEGEWDNEVWGLPDWPNSSPSLNDITFRCYNLPSAKYPPSGKAQAVYQSLFSLRKEEKVVLLEGVYYKTDNTTVICEQIKHLLNDYTARKAVAKKQLDGYDAQLRYFYALYQHITATGSYEGFVNHWSNRNKDAKIKVDEGGRE